MKKLLTATIVLGAVASFAGGSELPRKITDETPAQEAERMAWWQNDRFGMFIHFGLYSVPGRHEWIRTFEAIDNETYDTKYLPRFDPDLFDAKECACRTVQDGRLRTAALSTLGAALRPETRLRKPCRRPGSSLPFPTSLEGFIEIRK